MKMCVTGVSGFVGNQADFGLLLNLLQTCISLPLASVRNRRSFPCVKNPSDLVAKCLTDPKACGKICPPSDGEDVSTPELIRAVVRANADVHLMASGREQRGSRLITDSTSQISGDARLFSFPQRLLKISGQLPGLGAVQKLTTYLYVAGEPLYRHFGCTPPFDIGQGLRFTIARI